MYQLVRNPYGEQKSSSSCRCCFVFFIIALGTLAIVGAYSSIAKIMTPALTAIDMLKEPETAKAFEEFIKKYDRAYASEEEFAYRYKVFAKNYHYITESNADPTNTFTLEANKFADLTDEEFSKYYLTKPREIVQVEQKSYVPPNNSLFVDWTPFTTKVKDQGMCGSCWTFSTVSVFETLRAINDKSKLEELSEQELVDCCKAPNYTLSKGCNGGEEEEALAYLAKNGVMTRKDYPYTATDNECSSNEHRIRIENMNHLNTAKNEGLEKYIQKNSLSVGVAAGYYAFRFYKSGIVNQGCPDHPLTHAVTLVGAGSTDDKVPYWVIRNSWGPNWGDKGHIRFLRLGEGNGICGVASEAKLPYIQAKASE